MSPGSSSTYFDWSLFRKKSLTAIDNDLKAINIWRLKLMSVECEKKITEAFQRNAAFDAEKIKVETVGSKVIRVGIVRSLAEKDDAEDAIWAAPGVMGI